jgi:hypothetical protein
MWRKGKSTLRIQSSIDSLTGEDLEEREPYTCPKQKKQLEPLSFSPSCLGADLKSYMLLPLMQVVKHRFG